MTPARRGRGDGTLTEIKPGVWRLRVYVGTDPVTHRPIQASQNFHGHRSAALKALRVLSQEVAEGRHGSTKRTTVAFLLTEWQNHLDDQRRTTRESYAGIITKHLIPALGHIELRKLNAYDLDSYYKAKRDKLSVRTIRLHHAILSSALQRAVDWSWIGVNPAAAAKPPKLPQEKGKTPELEEVRSLIDAAQSDDEAMIVRLAAITGARRGELAGLQWGDVDWQRGTITIQRQRVPVKGGNETGPLKHGDQRRVAVGGLGLEALRRYRAVIEDRARQLKSEPGPWLLSPECGDEPFRAQTVGFVISRLGKEAGVDVTAHALRRFAATQLVGLGTDVVTTASRLGHTPQILLDRYAGIRPGADVDAARQLEAKVLGVLPAAD